MRKRFTTRSKVTRYERDRDRETLEVREEESCSYVGEEGQDGHDEDESAAPDRGARRCSAAYWCAGAACVALWLVACWHAAGAVTRALDEAAFEKDADQSLARSLGSGPSRGAVYALTFVGVLACTALAGVIAACLAAPERGEGGWRLALSAAASWVPPLADHVAASKIPCLPQPLPACVVIVSLMLGCVAVYLAFLGSLIVTHRCIHGRWLP